MPGMLIKVIALVLRPPVGAFYRISVAECSTPKFLPTYEEAKKIFGVRTNESWKNGSYYDLPEAEEWLDSLVHVFQARGVMLKEPLRITVRVNEQKIEKTAGP